MLAIKNVILLAVMFGACGENAVAQQDPGPKFSLRLNEKLISNLKSNGSLNSRPPENYQGKLGAIVVRGWNEVAGESKLSPRIQVIGNIAIVELNLRNLDFIQANEIRFECRNKTFGRIILKYVGDEPIVEETHSSDAAPEETPDPKPKKEEQESDVPTVSRSSISKLSHSILESADGAENPLRKVQQASAREPVDVSREMFCRMIDGELVKGAFDRNQQITLKTLIGDVKIPLDVVVGIRITNRSKLKSVVVLTNGDSLSGVLSEARFSLQTNWGQAILDSTNIVSITKQKEQEFSVSDSPFGPRWELIPESVK